jgi:hypothetical protein
LTSRHLTPTEIAEVQATLADARAGRASLTQLAHAHDLVNTACAPGVVLQATLGELRKHIRNATPSPPSQGGAMRDIALGVFAGFITEYLLHSRK